MSALSNSAPAFRHSCRICGKSYAHSSHLRRHEVIHTDQRPYQCPFCERHFAKTDVARRHIKNCASKNGHPLPPKTKRGRKFRACDRCSRHKISCDAKRPTDICTRCQRQGLSCSFGRIEDVDSTETPSQVPFLLRYSSTSTDTTAAPFVDDSMSHDPPQNIAGQDGRWATPEPFVPCIVHDHLSFWSPDAMDEELGQMELPIPRSDTLALEERMDEIVDQLVKTHVLMASRGPDQLPPFDIAMARSVFTAHNASEILLAYFHYCHGYMPFIHRPSFAVDQVSLPLLLALIMAGSFFSPPKDHALSARNFLRTAEELIFSQESLQNYTEIAASNLTIHDVQALQAALAIIMVQGEMNDCSTRRRIRLKRFPVVVGAVRAWGFTRIRHPDARQEWMDYAVEEVRIRLGMYTFMYDCHFVMFYNSPPQMMVGEMTGHLPCREDLFEAEDAAAFERLIYSPAGTSLEVSLHGMVSTLLHGLSLGPKDFPYKDATLLQLHFVLLALQPTVFLARTSCFGQIAFSAILRATDRWRELWDITVRESGGSQLHMSGFMRRATEICWLIRTVARVADAGDTSCRYMQNIGTDSLADIYQFISKHHREKN